jgi:hypothetical protein
MLRDNRVFFGHQSVGENIVDALRRGVTADGGPPLRVVEADQAPQMDGGFFCHARIGRNRDPRAKTRAFVEAMLGPLGERVDIALHKYCYVDVREGTEIGALFEEYVRAMADLRAARPRVRWVHVTVPLMAAPGGVQAAVRRLLGRPHHRERANECRERFNELLRSRYHGREPIFDLAMIEADARTPPSLASRFTDDGGHLNALGQEQAARALLRTLAEAA